MDPMGIAGMIFTLVALILIGGLVLLYPLSRQLAALVHLRLERGSAPDPSEQVEALTGAVESLRAEVERLAERQDFTERLLERPSSSKTERE